MSFVLYDIPSTSGAGTSPACWAVRYILNYKKVPFTTCWTEYPDIETLYKENDITVASINFNVDGTPRYTLPVLYDNEAQIFISDSFEITKYLEKKFPQSNTVFPASTINLQAIFTEALQTAIFPNLPFLIVIICRVLNPRSAEAYRGTREKMLGKRLEEVAPTPQDEQALIDKFHEFLGKINGWYSHSVSGSVEDAGPFIMGHMPSWTDFVVAAVLSTVRTSLGRESEKWRNIMLWHDGRWAKLMAAVAKYQ